MNDEIGARLKELRIFLLRLHILWRPIAHLGFLCGVWLGGPEAAERIQQFMSEEVVTQDREVVRSYQVPWKGQLVLVCRKCQKKLKHGGKRKGIAKLGKALKKRARDAEDGLKLHVIEVPCLKMCPKEGVTVCTQRQLGRGECSIVWSGADVDALIENM